MASNAPQSSPLPLASLKSPFVAICGDACSVIFLSQQKYFSVPMSLLKVDNLRIDGALCLSSGTFFVYITCLVSVPFAFQPLTEFSSVH